MPGDLLLHYRILEPLGRGGMGVVYKAEDTRLRRLVALKFLTTRLARHSAARQRFLAEAQAASALNHPNICIIHAVEDVPEPRHLAFDGAADAPTGALPSPWDAVTGEVQDWEDVGGPGPGVPEAQSFIVMEYIRGTPLSERIAAGPASVAEWINLAAQIAEGLSEAHGHGIVHRDIKPHNIMVTEPGLAKIMDFGLARREDADPGAPTGSTMGTLAYMSPEQIRGDRVDHRTDLFSLGVVLYELAAGRRPFEAADPGALLRAIAHADPLAPSETGAAVPHGVERVVMKCLRPDPADRYQSAAELLADVRALERQLAEAAIQHRADREQPRGPDRESERRQATIMFGDISSRSAAVDALESEDLTQAADELMASATGLAARYGGTVDRVMGGSFTVLFGLPTAAEHSARQALNAAIAIRHAVREANYKLPAHRRFAVRLGINTGTVLAGTVSAGGDRKYAVLGEAVLLASRLKDHAPDGHIYVGPLTYRQTLDEFTLERVPSVHLKEKKETVAVFEVLSVEPVEPGPVPAPARGVSSAIVGRDEDLNLLRRHLKAVLDGTGAIVTVAGEPGVGKSRLVAELLRGRAAGSATVLHGRALSTGQNLGYHPIIDLLKGWAGVRDDDTRTEVSRKVEAVVREVSLDLLPEMFPFIATMMGLALTGPYAERVKGIEGEALARLIGRSLRDLLDTAAAIRPVVVILEDLHWADQSSVELLEGLFRLAQRHRILFITTFRPDYETTSRRILETVRSRYRQFHGELQLRPLDEAHAGVLLERLVDVRGLPGGVQAHILERTGGNPLFIEEVVRSFLDEGAIELVGGAMRVTPKIHEVVIPNRIQDLLIARIDLLDERTRSLLKIAAVIGRSFLRRILVAVAPGQEAIEENLERLMRSDLIRREERQGEIEYVFNHALTQEAVYDTMVPRTLRSLHLQVAAAIETTFAERLSEFYGMLALHYSRGESYDKAEEYLIKAGAEAIQTAASSEAIHFYQEALDIYLRQAGATADPDRKAHMEQNIGLAFYNKGRMVEAVEHFDRALAYWGAWRPRGRLATAVTLARDLTSLIARLYLPARPRSRVPDAREYAIIGVFHRKGTAIVSLDARRYFVESAGLLRRINRYDLRRVRNGAAIYAAASALFSVPGISFTLSRRILDFTRPFIDPADPRTVLYYRFSELMLNLLAGHWDAGPAYNPALVEANRKIGEEWFLSVYIVVHAAIAIEKGRFEEAGGLLRTLDELAETYENELLRGRKHLLTTRLLLKQRRLDEARAEAQAGIAGLARIDHPMLLLYAYGLKANVEILRDDAEAADDALRQSGGLLERLGRVPPYYVSSYRVSRLIADLRELAAARDRDPASVDRCRRAARASAREARRVSNRNASDRPEILRLLGTLCWLSGRSKQALAWWDRSRSEGERLGAIPEVARTYLEVAGRLSEGTAVAERWNGLTAGEARARARTCLEAYGLAWDRDHTTTAPVSSR